MAGTIDYLTHLAADSARFADVLAEVDPTRPVPSCPDWTAVDLLWHLTDVQWFWGTVVVERLQDPHRAEQEKPERPRDADALLHLFTTASERLHDALRDTPPETPVWTWSRDRTAGFVRRRQCHEALMHRVDAELTAGLPSELDAALATDGVDEALRVMYGSIPAWGRLDRDGSHVVVESTDTGRRWELALGRFTGTDPRSGTAYDEPGFEVLAEPGPAAAAVVRGPAADLDRWLWNRLSADHVERSGDAEVLARLQAVIDEGLQ